MYSILMAGANIGIAFGNYFSSTLVDHLSFKITFAIIASFNLLACLLVPIMFCKRGAYEILKGEDERLNHPEITAKYTVPTGL
jgi:hypothetical protein